MDRFASRCYYPSTNMLARLTRRGISSDATQSELRSARDHFAQHNYLRLPGFIDPALLRVIQRHLQTAGFEQKDHDVGREFTLSDNSLANVLHLLMNDPELFRLIKQIAECSTIRRFSGRLYQLVAHRGQTFAWHDDMTHNRKVAISINFSDAPYRGGTLHLRDKSRIAYQEVPNLGYGDAIIFRVAANLQHRVKPITGTVPKTAFTGWFSSRPGYTLAHRALIARSDSAITVQAANGHRSLIAPSPNDAVTVPGTVISQTFGHETFVARIGTVMCFGLNETGGRIWQLLDQGRKLRSISETIAREYVAPRREIERDVLALARQLAQRDLIKLVRKSKTRR